MSHDEDLYAPYSEDDTESGEFDRQFVTDQVMNMLGPDKDQYDVDAIVEELNEIGVTDCDNARQADLEEVISNAYTDVLR